MTINVNNWEHRSGYHLNADGKYIAYEHTEKPYEAIVEGILDESSGNLEYYTAIFDQSTSNPTETIEEHEFFIGKQNALDHLKKLMEKHS